MLCGSIQSNFGRSDGQTVSQSRHPCIRPSTHPPIHLSVTQWARAREIFTTNQARYQFPSFEELRKKIQIFR